MSALLERTEVGEEILARREQLWTLKGCRLEAAPARGWQSFFVDLWEAVEFEGRMEIGISREPADESFLEIGDGISLLRLDREVCAETLRAASENHLEDGRIRVNDGMISLIRNRCARVVAVVDELCTADPSWLDVVVCALQWAAWQGAGPEEMRAALLKLCMGRGRLSEAGNRGGLRFLDGSAFRTQEEAMRALRWISDPSIVVLGGDFFVLDSRLEETMISGGCSLVHLMDLPRSQRSVLRRYVDVHAVPTMKAAVVKSLKISEGESRVLCFPAIGCSEIESVKLGSRWAEAVNGD